MASSIETIPTRNQYIHSLQDIFNIREKFPLFRLEILAGQTLCCQCRQNHIQDGSVSETTENCVPAKK